MLSAAMTVNDSSERQQNILILFVPVGKGLYCLVKNFIMSVHNHEPGHFNL